MPMRTVLGFVAYVADTGEGKPAILKGAQGNVYSVNDAGLTTPQVGKRYNQHLPR